MTARGHVDLLEHLERRLGRARGLRRLPAFITLVRGMLAAHRGKALPLPMLAQRLLRAGEYEELQLQMPEDLKTERFYSHMILELARSLPEGSPLHPPERILAEMEALVLQYERAP